MLCSISDLRNLRLTALDGNIGVVDDFYFEEATWTIRYIVVDTGGWLRGRLVLLSPASVTVIDRVNGHMEVNLTRAQVENSPGIDAHQTVSRQHEMELAKYYDWPSYWSEPVYRDWKPFTTLVRTQEPPTPSTEAGPTLRSLQEVTGYHIHATDDKIGHLDDFIVRDEDWGIRYLVVDTRNWLPGKRVLVAPEWVTGIHFTGQYIDVNLTRDAISKAPRYDPGSFMTTHQEKQLMEETKVS